MFAPGAQTELALSFAVPTTEGEYVLRFQPGTQASEALHFAIE